MDQIKAIYESVITGDIAATEKGVKEALTAHTPAEMILKNGLVAAMQEVGRLFEMGEIFVPEMFVSAKATQAALASLKPHLISGNMSGTGRIVIGTVQGDLHDIGKSLVGMMLEGYGFEVFDLGTDVSAEKFITAIQEHRPDVLAMSALLTTTMTNMATTVQALLAAGVRDQVKVIIGGAPVTSSFCQQIGADGYAQDAGGAARLVESLLRS